MRALRGGIVLKFVYKGAYVVCNLKPVGQKFQDSLTACRPRPRISPNSPPEREWGFEDMESSLRPPPAHHSTYAPVIFTVHVATCTCRIIGSYKKDSPLIYTQEKAISGQFSSY